MEITKISLVILLLLTISSHYVVVFGQQPPKPSALDIDGDQLQPNTKYHIFALNHGGGGLALSIRDHRRNPCPPNVMLETDESSVGLSLKIFPVDKKQLHVNLVTDLNFVFMAATICVQPTVWRIGEADWSTGRRYVRSGGVLGRAGAETVGNWFKMERFGEGYKVVYCPSVCSGCRVECGEVGVFVENGRSWLGLGSDHPLVVAFEKVR